MARTTYRIEYSKDGSNWRTFMIWSGLQKCRAEGAFGILRSMYDGVWYRLVEEGGQVIEVSHRVEPSVGKKRERVFTESEVKAMLVNITHECGCYEHRGEPVFATSVDDINHIAAKHGILLDPA